MNSTAQMTDENLETLSRNKTGNMVKGLSTIYNMNSKKQMASKQTNTNLSDTIVPDIKVPIMKTNESKPSKPKRFSSRKWFQNAVKQTNLQITHWILNTEKYARTVALARHQIANRFQDVSPCHPLPE